MGGAEGRVTTGKTRSGWEEERKKYYDSRGWKVQEIEELRQEGALKGKIIAKVESNLQREERWKRIREAKYNKLYGRVKGEGIPGYFKKE